MKNRPDQHPFGLVGTVEEDFMEMQTKKKEHVAASGHLADFIFFQAANNHKSLKG